MDLRDYLGTDQSVGLAQAGFRRKSQTAIQAKNDAMRQNVDSSTTASSKSRTLPSGRQETVVTTGRRGTLPTQKVSYCTNVLHMI